MATQEKRKGGGGKLSRTETVTVRLDPKLRYLAELASRKQRRTLSSFIEWAVQDSLERIWLRESDSTSSIADETNRLWDVDDADRFAKLALRYPDMLTHDEQVRWKLIQENGFLWRGREVGSKWAWKVEESSLIFERLREHWDKFIAVAQGDAEKSILPAWKTEEPKKSGFDDFDEDIPF